MERIEHWAAPNLAGAKGASKAAVINYWHGSAENFIKPAGTISAAVDEPPVEVESE